METSNYYLYDNIKLGYGNFNLPPILIGTIFYQGETIFDRNDEKIFDQQKAKKRIDLHFSLSKTYNIPSLIEISATNPDAMIKYIDFYLDNYKPPFVLGGTFESRMVAIEHLKERGIKSNEYVYNTISNLKNKQELEVLKRCKINSVVVLILGSENMNSSQRYASITRKDQPGNTSIIEGLKQIGIEKIWVDGGVISLDSLANILELHQLVSTSLKLPVGTAPNLFLFKYSSPSLNLKFHTKYRRASIMFIASWFSNFLFYGAIEDAKECFTSTYQALEFKKIVKKSNIKLL